MDKLIGLCDPDSNLYTGTLQQVCSLGGFEVKEIIRSGDVNDKATHLLGDSVLGYLWYTKEDLMAVKLRVNLSKKRRKLAKYLDFSMENINDIRKVTLTYSKALSLISTQFDPLGMISPWISTLKVALAKMRTLEKGMTYDTVIPEQYKEFWYFRCEEAVKFERTLKPQDSDGSYLLFISWDASSELFFLTLTMFPNWCSQRPKLILISATLLQRWNCVLAY